VLAEVIDDLVEALGLEDAVWGADTSGDDSDEDPDESDPGPAAELLALGGRSSTARLFQTQLTSSVATSNLETSPSQTSTIAAQSTQLSK